MDLTRDELNEIADMVAYRIKYCIKDVLTTREAAMYMGITMSYLYKLTMDAKIPCYKPNGKVVFFDRKELEQWLLRNKVEVETNK